MICHFVAVFIGFCLHQKKIKYNQHISSKINYRESIIFQKKFMSILTHNSTVKTQKNRQESKMSCIINLQ